MPRRRQNKFSSQSLSSLERSLLCSGVEALAGVDEAGRGCLAGPVVAACVVYPEQNQLFPQVSDSKLLSPKRREELFDQICSGAQAWAIAAVSSEEIDAINIHQASLQAMKLAVQQVQPPPDYLLIDGKFTLNLSIAQQAVVRGDRQCQVIGAASILAKVWRDRLMIEYEASYPHFSFAQHKGYGTIKHRAEILRHGPTPIHRFSFRGVK